MESIVAGDLEARSPDIITENLEQLKGMFPEAFTEGKVDFDVLKQLLGGVVEERDEKYGLNWHGKRQARQLALTPSTGTLRPCPEDSVDWDTTQNIMIEGDNLEVLKLLQKSYAGKVKLIYIDPPYNTGKEFIYPDDYRDNTQNYLILTGQADDEKHRLSSNTETYGRYHTKWMNMIFPRLKIARNLLADDGVIFCSIDDIEVQRLRFLLDEIFGEENFLVQFVWRTDGNFDNQAKVKVCHEYIVGYVKSIDSFPHPPVIDPSVPEESKLFRPEIRNTIVKNGPKNPVSIIDLPAGFPASFESGIIVARDNPWPKYKTDAEIQDGRLVASTKIESGWSSKDLVLQYIKSGCTPIIDSKAQETSFFISRTGAIEVVKKRSDYPSHVISALNGFGGTQKASAELAEIGALFPGYPKPLDLLRYFVRMVSDQSSIMMDFFAGSGTLGHAILLQNAADEGSRRYILIQLPEVLDPHIVTQVSAVKHCDSIGRPRTIAELTKDRLRRAAKKIKEENSSFTGDLGFRVFKLDTSNIRAWESVPKDLKSTLLDSVDHIKADRSEEDILFELLLKVGLNLCVPINTRVVADKIVHSIGAGTLLACLADKITMKDAESLALGIADWHKELAPAGDTSVVFRDSAFRDDVTKTNLAAILEQHGLNNMRSL